MTTALEICERNSAGAKARDEAVRAKLRADFPEGTSLTKLKAAELAGDKSHPHLPPIKPRVIWMWEGMREWSR